MRRKNWALSDSLEKAESSNNSKPNNVGIISFVVVIGWRLCCKMLTQNCSSLPLICCHIGDPSTRGFQFLPWISYNLLAFFLSPSACTNHVRLSFPTREYVVLYFTNQELHVDIIDIHIVREIHGLLFCAHHMSCLLLFMQWTTPNIEKIGHLLISPSKDPFSLCNLSLSFT